MNFLKNTGGILIGTGFLFFLLRAGIKALGRARKTSHFVSTGGGGGEEDMHLEQYGIGGAL